MAQGKREFLIKWAKQGRTRNNSKTWEPESNLDGCINLLQDYCLKNSIPLSNIEAIYGSSNKDDNFNHMNWVTIPQVLKVLEKVRKIAKIGDIKFETLKTFENEDKIYFFGLDKHLYVLYYNYKEKLAFVSNGGNNLKCRSKFELVSSIIKENGECIIQIINYFEQIKKDFCGSSAAIIAIAFAQY